MNDDDIHTMYGNALKTEYERLRRDAEWYRWICRFPEDADYAITRAR